ncbi:hypothetical protein M5689_017094 [Euphorbia peplus]|nr:hypothetical protein M5689_017094 [Euphorbia peplus]
MARKPHLVLVPKATQGHVAPLMKLAYNLVDHGIKVTFVNTVSNHSKIMSALPHKLEHLHNLLNLVSIPELPDSPGKDPMDALRFSRTQLQNLIEKINEVNEDRQVTHLIADITQGWALKLADQMGINAVGFVAFGLASLCLILHIHKFIEDGNMDVNGMVKGVGSISLSEEIPAWNSQNVLWRYPFDEEVEKFIFRHFFYNGPEDLKCCKTFLANTFLQLETAPCNMIPNVLPIGPLLSRDVSFHNKDNICKYWKVGIEVIPDEENGIVTRDEIKYKIEKLVCDEDIKANCLKFKEMAEENVKEGGTSLKNFKSFIEQIKE